MKATPFALRRLVAAAASAAALATTPLAAQEPADSARGHVVRPGDTLWDLARRYLSDPFRWSEIFQLNRGRVQDPDLIRPDWLLRIPGMREAGAAPSDPSATELAAAARTVFWQADRRAQAALLEFGDAADAPLVAAGDFLRAGVLVGDDEVAPVGRLAERVGPSAVPLQFPPQIGPYSRVFLTLQPGAAVRVGDRLHLLRPGRRVEPIGRVFESTGAARVLEIDGAVATVEVDEMYDAVRVGDVAVPMPAFEPVLRASRRPGAASQRDGRIVAFQEVHSLHGLHDLAFVDLGEASGVEEGDELVAVLPPEPAEWGRRPEIVVARLRVVRTTRQTSSAEVIELEHPALEAGLPVRWVGRAP